MIFSGYFKRKVFTMLKKSDIVMRLKGRPSASVAGEAISEIRRLRRELAIAKSANRLHRIEKVSDADCATAKECYSTIISKENRAKWMDEHDLFVSDGRVFAAVDTQHSIYFMDAITGSLHALGECLTSSTLRRTGFVRDREAAMKILLAAGTSTAPAPGGDLYADDQDE